jgi:hypothetical protein
MVKKPGGNEGKVKEVIKYSENIYLRDNSKGKCKLNFFQFQIIHF